MGPSRHRAVRWCLALAVCVAMCAADCSRASPPKSDQEPDYRVDVRWAVGEKGLMLDISVTSLLSVPITINESSLPWMCVHSIDLVAMTPEPAGAVLARMSPIDDPVAMRTPFRPGETLRGVVLLNEEFEDIAAVHRRSDILVFWSCQLLAYGEVTLQRKGGWLLIPRHRAGCAN